MRAIGTRSVLQHQRALRRRHPALHADLRLKVSCPCFNKSPGAGLVVCLPKGCSHMLTSYWVYVPFNLPPPPSPNRAV